MYRGILYYSSVICASGYSENSDLEKAVLQKKVVIMGAGPAGLAAAYQLARRGLSAVVIEKDEIVGGISRTVCRNGFRFDIGGHRFFTKIDRVNRLWQEVLGDDLLKRPRLSRIYYNNKFFNYPLKPINALMGLGLFNSIGILASFAASKLSPYPKENTFEEWVSNRFGKKLYRIFFKTYTEKVWAIPCSQIEAEWAAQRIKGLSLVSALKTALIGDKDKKIKTLIDEFDYPRLGPGQMYETMAEKFKSMGGQILMNTCITGLEEKDDKVISIEVTEKDGNKHTIEGTDFLSSIPLTELVKMFSRIPEEVFRAADNLSYRSLLTVNLMMNRAEIFPDTWIYIHSFDVKVGRIQCFKNWSPAMVAGDGVSSLGLEYFCTEGDRLWNAPDQELISLGKSEVDRLSLADSSTVFDAFVIRTPKTYPVYLTGYTTHLEKLKNFVTTMDNLQCIGRNGMFKYNNMDHSILSGLLAADNITGAANDLWSVNTEEQYHEESIDYN